MFDVTDLTRVTPTLDCRAITFENPTGARGSGGSAHNGRKGAPFRVFDAGERVVLGDIEGPGTVRHLWMTFPPATPEIMRAWYLEVFYDDLDEPSISVPVMDFVGLPLGRPRPVNSALAAVQEARGFNSFIPMPFGRRVRFELVNGSARKLHLYFQIDYTLGDLDEGTGRLHASFRRENPTTLRRDFVIEDGLRGPGRFLGCVVGIRCLDNGGVWYGEGEVKVYLDGDTDLPTICGTGLEDYVGTAWGMEAHGSHYAGVPLDVRRDGRPVPDFVGFYRWHVLDPIMFESSIKVTIQQIGYDLFFPGDKRLADFDAEGRFAGPGPNRPTSGRLAGVTHGIVERVDDYSAVALTMCRDAQAVPRLDLAAALADIERLDYEEANPNEALAMAATDE